MVFRILLLKIKEGGVEWVSAKPIHDGLVVFLIDHVCRELSNSQCGNNVFFAACQMCAMYIHKKSPIYKSVTIFCTCKYYVVPEE